MDYFHVIVNFIQVMVDNSHVVVDYFHVGADNFHIAVETIIKQIARIVKLEYISLRSQLIGPNPPSIFTDYLETLFITVVKEINAEYTTITKAPFFHRYEIR